MEQTDLTIRMATPADNGLLAELGARTFRDTFGPDNTVADMATYLALSFNPQKQATELVEPGSAFLIAEADGLPAGYARLREGRCPPGITGKQPIEIARIYVVRERIGQGVGAILMQACLAEAENRGCDTIWLDVWERNSRALAFYRKWGFVQVGTQVFQLGDDPQHDYLLQRPVLA